MHTIFRMHEPATFGKKANFSTRALNRTSNYYLSLIINDFYNLTYLLILLCANKTCTSISPNKELPPISTLSSAHVSGTQISAMVYRTSYANNMFEW